ncbi:hypothetical protein H0X10_00400 [Candidatus Saccharibacteria bacterium]|nr:hypothetical protein [Candidatus Saccharibacteria bacterium]
MEGLDFPNRLSLERPRTPLDSELSTTESNTWTRVKLDDGMDSMSCFEEQSPQGEVLGRVWVRRGVFAEETE